MVKPRFRGRSMGLEGRSGARREVGTTKSRIGDRLVLALADPRVGSSGGKNGKHGLGEGQSRSGVRKKWDKGEVGQIELSS